MQLERERFSEVDHSFSIDDVGACSPRKCHSEKIDALHCHYELSMCPDKSLSVLRLRMPQVTLATSQMARRCQAVQHVQPQRLRVQAITNSDLLTFGSFGGLEDPKLVW